MKKTILIVVAVLIIGGIALFSHLGGAVKYAIETAGSKTLGTKVTVGAVHLSLADKTASIDGLAVANPPGFETADILKTKSISVRLGDVSRTVAVIKNVTVDGLTVAYELGPKGTNVSALSRNIKSSAASSSSEKSAKSGGGMRVVIENLKIIHASVMPALAGQGKTIPLPDIVITNIGSESRPATAAQVAATVMSRVLALASTMIVKSELTSVPVNGAMQKATGALKGLFSK